MSVQTEPRPTVDPTSDTTEIPVLRRSERAEQEPAPRPRSEIVLVAAAAALASAAAGWMIGGVFDGQFTRVVAVIAAVAGAALVGLSSGSRRSAIAQYLAVPLAVAGGVGLAFTDPTARGAEIGALVTDALFSGGLAQPPVAFDPGWRLLVVAIVFLLAVAAASVALGFDRPKLAVLLPVPLVVGAALVQPPDAELVSTVVAFVLLVAALTVAYGVDLAQSGVSSGRFELRRLARGLVSLVVLAGGLVALASAASFLLPEPRVDQVIPPQRPEASPPMEDRELFTVESERRLPWRLGVLDVYEDDAWKLPSHDPARLVELSSDTEVPDAPPVPDEPLVATFEIVDLPGRALPTLATPHRVSTEGDIALHYDPRTQMLRLQQRIPAGLRYTVTALPPPTSDDLAESGPAGRELAPFLEAPPPPPAVTALIADAPRDSLFAQLQHLRDVLYENVVAAGAGEPVDLPAARVGEMLEGGEASPYEITAAEALIARWVGVPSRIGYGYFGGERSALTDPLSVRPERGSTWLEVYFDGHGWIPLVGTPERAKSSLSDAHKRDDPAVRPTDEIALITYVPVRLESLTLLFEVVRHYALRVVPVAVGLALLAAFYPTLLRALRRRRRRRWAAKVGPAGRIAIAYAELRDYAWDLNIGRPALTPIEFLDEVASDAEHRELAWLVSRALWGDLRRDLTDDDVETAESLARSVLRRLRSAQAGSSRMLAAASRASLREPFSDEMPNTWPRRRRRSRRGGIRRTISRVRLPRIRRLVPRLSTTLLIASLILLTGCVAAPDMLVSGEHSLLPEPAVPEILGDLRFQREPSAEEPFADAGPAALVDHGRVYSIRRGETVEASLQIAQFKPGLRGREDDVRNGLLQSLGAGRFEPARVGEDPAYTLATADQRLYLWFSPDGTHYQLLVARRAFAEAGDVLGAVIAFQRGEDVTSISDRPPTTKIDPRRGLP